MLTDSFSIVSVTEHMQDIENNGKGPVSLLPPASQNTPIEISLCILLYFWRGPGSFKGILCLQAKVMRMDDI